VITSRPSGTPLVTELLPKGLAVYFVVLADPAKTRRGLDEGSSNTPYLWIPTFLRHQRVDKPSQPLIDGWAAETTPFDREDAQIIPAGPPSDGLPEFDPDPNHASFRGGLGEDSRSARRGLRTGKERKGEERKGKERRGSTAAADGPAPLEEVAEPIRLDVEQVCQRMADSVEQRGERRPVITDRWRRDARLILDPRPATAPGSAGPHRVADDGPVLAGQRARAAEVP